MAQTQPQQNNEESYDPLNAILSEFGTRINEIEEKQRLLKDRILLIGENLISTKEEELKKDLEIKKHLKQIDQEIYSMKSLLSRIIGEISNSARKSELGILERQMKMFLPLELARIKDVKKIVKKEIKKLEKKEKNVQTNENITKDS
jgi:hypothetical protein